MAAMKQLKPTKRVCNNLHFYAYKKGTIYLVAGKKTTGVGAESARKCEHKKAEKRTRSHIKKALTACENLGQSDISESLKRRQNRRPKKITV